jgi:aminoglycoside phosphotransferase (APT) family kinase protein
MESMMVSELIAAVGLPPHTVAVAAGGRAGRTWKVLTSDGPRILRLAESRVTALSQLAAMRAAKHAGLPVPAVDRCEAIANGIAMLLTWMPGETIREMLRRHPESAPSLGSVMGDAQRRLHEVQAPAELGEVAGWRHASPPENLSRQTLLHLDWHWRNILVDDDGLSGIIDWDNAGRGHPLLDLARTYTLFTVDPALALLTPEERPLLAGLAAGWSAGYGRLASTIPPECFAWAGRAMLRDVADRFASTPDALTGLEAWIGSVEREFGRGGLKKSECTTDNMM